jgi:hypothetical protein
MWLTQRKTTTEDFGSAVKLPSQINTSRVEGAPYLSYDGSTLYFSSNNSGGYGWNDTWKVSIEPVVDLNSDGIVDSEDMCIMVECWGTDESLCDIGPMPWGDGFVDVQDLIVLAEHLFEELGLVAHWKLDETEGNTAYDSIGYNDGTINGEPAWQPESGIVNGALQLNGVDDYIATPFVLSPADGEFSIFTWVKGGGPGQVIISQAEESGEVWLGIDSSEGKLITGIFDVFFDPLVSDTVVTDGQWHHVGIVYDLDVYHRRLYVDGTLVAEDTTVVYGVSSDGGLYIGAPKDLEAGSFFSGLIDDVRIYNRVVIP